MFHNYMFKKIKSPFLILISAIVFLFAISLYIYQPHIKDANYIIYFGEFTQSSDFQVLVSDKLHSFSDRMNLGVYNLGLPVPPQKESVFGTNNGVRTLPLLVFLSFMQKVFGTLWDRLYLLIVLLAPFIVFYKTARWKKSSIFWANIGAMCFAFNPWIFSRLSTGFWQLHLAYACMPFLLFYIFSDIKSFSKLKKLNLIISSMLSFSVVYFFQPHFLLILLIISFVFLVIEPKNLKLLLSNYKYHLLVLFGGLVIISFHIIPSLSYSPYNITLPNQYLNLGSVRFNGSGSKLHNVFRLENSGFIAEELFAENFSDYLKYGFFILGIISILNMLTQKKERRFASSVLFLLILFSFLSKGLNDPFEEISTWLYKNIQILRPFRDPTRFYAACAFLISLSVSRISIKNKIFSNSLKGSIVIWLVLLLPSMTINFSKSIELIKIPDFYFNNKIISTYDGRDSHISYFPQNILIPSYSWSDESRSPGTHTSLFDSLIPLKTGLAQYSGYPDTFLSQLMLFSYSNLAEQKYITPFELFNSELILLDKNLISTSYAANGVDQIEELFNNNLTLLNEDNNIYSYKYSPEPIITSKEPIFVVGNISTFSKLFDLFGDKFSIILLNQSFNIDSFIKRNVSDIPIFYEEKGELENLWLNSYREKFALPLAEEVWHYDKDWNLNEPYIAEDIKSGIFFNSGRSVVSSKKDDILRINDYSINQGSYVMAISYLSNNKEHRVSLNINNEEFDLPETPFEDRFAWFITPPFEVGNENIVSKIEFINQENKKIIIDNALLIPFATYNNEKEKYQKLLNLSEKRSISDADIEDNFYEKSSDDFAENKVIFSKISGQKYDVFTDDDWITARIPFNPHWRLGDKSPIFIADFYGMIFDTKEFEKEYLVYEPELIYRKFLSISGSFTLILLGIFIYQNLLKKIKN